jgi:DNA-binding HxlR family transcriptional regulator
VRIEECNVSAALAVIGGKWKPLILWALKQGPHRFSELRRKVPGASSSGARCPACADTRSTG